MEKMTGESLDLTQENIKRLKELFPEVLTEKKIDFEKLRLILGDEVETSPERYEFRWNGKNEAIKLSQTPSMGTLRPDKESSKNWDTTENLYIEGDNLEVLKLLQKSYFGKIKMIYIDPPYNTGKDFVYKDNFHDNIANYKEITNQSTKANPETNGRFHTDWLNMMYTRLKISRNLLKEDGIIAISIGKDEVHNCRKLCDEIFGEINLVEEVIWNCSTGGGIRPKFFSLTHEYVLIYAKNKLNLSQIDAPLSDAAIKLYNKSDKYGLYREKDFVFKNSSNNINQKYVIECPDGERVVPKEGYIYRFIKESFEAALKDDLVVFKQTNTGPLNTLDGEQAKWNIYIKKHLGDGTGAPTSLLPKEQIGIYNNGTKVVQDLFDGKRVFENPKPIELINYLINLFVKTDDIVLDFFSGSGSTAHSIINLNNKDDIKRRFILVQLPQETDLNSIAQQNGYSTICEIGKERLRRVGNKVLEDSNNKDLDIGFKVFKLDDSNIKTWDPNTKNLENTLFNSVQNLKEDRKQEDLLYELMLKMGIELTANIEEINVDGKIIYNIQSGGLVICLEDEITKEVIDFIPNLKSPFMDMKVVFKEDGFKFDADKMNAIQNLKQHGIKDVRSV